MNNMYNKRALCASTAYPPPKTAKRFLPRTCIIYTEHHFQGLMAFFVFSISTIGTTDVQSAAFPFCTKCEAFRA